MRSGHHKKARQGSVRIIGGDWRGRKLPVADAPGLRPSGDRVRETVFNWLQPIIGNARCADVFAGTGALGFEAASRGASRVTLVERSSPLVAALRESARTLDAQQVKIVEGDALQWLAGRQPGSLDLVFIDPPFGTDLARRALDLLAENSVLAEGGMVYLESARPDPPRGRRGFVPVREKVIGEVRLQLLQAVGED